MKRPVRIGLIAEGEAELGPSVPYIKPNQNAGGLAIKNFDTWLLADEKALITLLAIKPPFKLPENLETLPADKTADHYAKTVLDVIIEKSEYLLTQKKGLQKLKIRWELAFKLNTTHIKHRCPQGYKPFMQKICNVAQTIQHKLSLKNN